MADKIDLIGQVLTDFADHVCEVFVGFIRDNERDVIDENVMQLMRGKMPNGEYITPQYAMLPDNPTMGQYLEGTYADYKRYGAGNTFDIAERPMYTPNLGLSGAFYESIGIMYGSDSIQIVATDTKWDGAIHGRSQNLHERYGDVLGLTEDYMKGELADGVKELIRGRLMERLRSIV